MNEMLECGLDLHVSTHANKVSSRVELREPPSVDEMYMLLAAHHDQPATQNAIYRAYHRSRHNVLERWLVVKENFDGGFVP